MYSPQVIDKVLWLKQRGGLSFERRSVEFSVGAAEKLSKLTRPYTSEEQAFVRSETILTRYDFRYWAERYGWREIDSEQGGGIGLSDFWPSQERALEQIAQQEEQNYEQFQKHGFADGIRGVWHKTRQQGATALLRLIAGHRLSCYSNIRAIAASLDDTKIREIYKRDKIWYDNLPPFLKPQIQYDVKGSHLSFAKRKSAITYQQANQEAGIGTSQQFDIWHMTEVALWDNPWRLEFDFLPAVPRSINTFGAFESTANGRGEGNFWYEFTESVRKKEEGFESWIYVFTPWYLNSNKNRKAAPFDWSPNELTVEHAELIERTSAEFCGKTIHPSRDQLYWWESEYKRNKRLGTLNIFLTNYPATPEQSFQHSAHAALLLETIERMRTRARMPMLYAVEREQRAPALKFTPAARPGKPCGPIRRPSTTAIFAACCACGSRRTPGANT